MKRYRVTAGYLSIPAMGEWHCQTIIVEADTEAEAKHKACSRILGWDFDVTVEEEEEK